MKQFNKQNQSAEIIKQQKYIGSDPDIAVQDQNQRFQFCSQGNINLMAARVCFILLRV